MQVSYSARFVEPQTDAHETLAPLSAPDGKVRIWLCECGRVHVEGRHRRLSYQPQEFIKLLRQAASSAAPR